MTDHLETLVRALWRPILLRGVGFWLGVRAMVTLVTLLLAIDGVRSPSLAIPVTVVGLAMAHSVAMKETIYYRNLGIRWLPIAGPGFVAAGMELMVALIVPGS